MQAGTSLAAYSTLFTRAMFPVRDRQECQVGAPDERSSQYRQAYGRAGFAVLRQRTVLAA